MIIAPPAAHETFGFYDHYIKKFAADTDLITALTTIHNDTLALLNPLSDEALNYRYAEEKWSIKEILQHLIDAERNFGFRAMRFARGEQSVIPGYDVHTFVTASLADTRTKEDLLQEWELLRNATLLQYKTFHLSVLELRGPARDTQLSVRSIGFLIAGHEMHHINVIKEKYLVQQSAIQ